MKKLTYIALFLVVAMLFAACVQKPKDPAETEETPNLYVTEGSETTLEESAEYGALQTIVDTYGFPLCLRLTEGMELTRIEIFEDSAERYWTSSLSDHPTLHENLTWSIEEDHLVISGEWEQEFIIHIEAGTATSLSDGKEYRLIVYDENGDGHFYVE